MKSFDASDLIKKLSTFEGKADAAVRAYADTSALQLQNYARKNARWVNRTGHARQQLTGDYLDVANGYKLRLAHGVDYGLYLELAHEKKYAIIPETISIVGQNTIMPGFKSLLEKLSI